MRNAGDRLVEFYFSERLNLDRQHPMVRLCVVYSAQHPDLKLDEVIPAMAREFAWEMSKKAPAMRPSYRTLNDANS
jgi:hypothetical protein